MAKFVAPLKEKSVKRETAQAASSLHQLWESLQVYKFKFDLQLWELLKWRLSIG